MSEFILPLTAAGVDLATAGGKGANLHRLLAAGLPVPPGFVLTTAAYQAYVTYNRLQPVIAAAVAGIDTADPDSYATASATIQAAFRAGHIPAEVLAPLQEAYRTGSGRGPVAVRSSATAEDLPSASFAGQQDSYLNVSGEAALLEAVVACWSSLWTARAIAYRARQRIDPETAALAVVVQQMVPAVASGVLFTVNPVSGARDEMVLNATWGLGEALVAGRVTPDTFVVNREDGTVLSQTVGDKVQQTVAVPGGTAERATTPAQREAPALQPAQIGALVALGRTIEAHFDAPQDVEWAIDGDGAIAIVQSRPVTVAPAAVPGDDAWPPPPTAPQPFDRWTQADVGERWPEPVTPLTWSTGLRMINENMEDSFGLGDEPEAQAISWARRAYGRVYFNEGALIHVFTHKYGLPATMLEASLSNPEYVTAAQKRYRWRTLLRQAPQMLRMNRTWERNAQRFAADFPRIDRRVDDFMARSLTALNDRVLWQKAEETWYRRLLTYMEYHANVTSMSFNTYASVSSALKRWLQRPDLIHDLTAGLSGVIAAEIVPALWALVREIEAAGLAPLLLDAAPDEAWVQLQQTEAAAPFLAELDAFLQRHGHRCMVEAEWLYPRWIEAPQQVIASLAGYLRAGETFDRTATEAQQATRQKEAFALVDACLGPLRRATFRRQVQRLQHLLRLRDNGQHYLVKLLLPIRVLYATLGRRWADRGWLANADQFFFLVLPEIEAVLAGGSPTAAGIDLTATATARRAAYDHWFSQPFPEVLDEQGKPLVAAVTEGENVLRGVAASAGSVSGAARVVLSPQDAGQLQPGEILVTRATDPGWTPAFSVIGGLVLEVGGQLSHGAIVAREYGLPAVVNVPGATQLIRDGRVVTVDGSAGVVYLDESEVH